MTPASARFTRIFYFTVIPFPASCCCCFYSRCSFVIAPFGISTFTFRLAAHILERFETPLRPRTAIFFCDPFSLWVKAVFKVKYAWHIGIQGCVEWLTLCSIKYATLWLQHVQHCSHFSCSSSPLLLLSSPPPPRPTPLSFSSFSLTDPVCFVLRVYLAQVVFALAAAVAACFLSTYILALNSFLVFFVVSTVTELKTHTHILLIKIRNENQGNFKTKRLTLQSLECIS